MAKSFNNPEKRAAWKAFSSYKRTYDCLKTTGSPIVGVYITCGKRFQHSFLQAGHYLDGRKNAVLFNMKFVNAQCPVCNEVFHGRKKRYRKALVKIHGEAFVDKWENKLKGLANRGAINDKGINWKGRTKRYNRLRKKLLHDYGLQTLGENLKGK